MLFYLTSLHVSYVLTDFEPTNLYLVDGENVPTEAQVANYEKMNAAKPVVKQLEELQIIVHEIEVEGMDMSFEQLVLKIHVEEDNRMNEKDDANSIEPNTNMVRESSSKSNGKPGHGVKDCRRNKEHGDGNFIENSNQANHVESLKEFAGVIESFLNTNVVDWWFDIGATKHICNSMRMFVSYQKVNEPEPMFMGNKTALKIEEKRKVILKLTFRKDLVLLNVLHVPNITKNMIFGPTLSNKGF
ncbi:hypothetical protein Tco_0693613 [Tanacetum coccineum]